MCVCLCVEGRGVTGDDGFRVRFHPCRWWSLVLQYSHEQNNYYGIFDAH